MGSRMNTNFVLREFYYPFSNYPISKDIMLAHDVLDDLNDSTGVFK